MSIEAYNAWNLFFNLLTSVGTLGAVFTALYLSRHQDMPRINVWANTAFLVNHPQVPADQRFVNPTATNYGVIDEYIGTYGYQMGLFRKWTKRILVNPSLNNFETRFPATIQPGSRVSDFIKIELFDELQLPFFLDYIDNTALPSFIKRQSWFPALIMKTARCWVSPGRGKIATGKLGDELTKHILGKYTERHKSENESTQAD